MVNFMGVVMPEAECPHCGLRIIVPPEHMGQQHTCKSCHRDYTLTEAPEESPALQEAEAEAAEIWNRQRRLRPPWLPAFFGLLAYLCYLFAFLTLLVALVNWSVLIAVCSLPILIEGLVFHALDKLLTTVHSQQTQLDELQSRIGRGPANMP